MGVVLAAILTTAACAQLPAPPGNAVAAAAGVTHPRPPLILGTNLALFDSSDQVLNNRSSQKLLERAQVPIIRMPFRSAHGEVWELEALRAIQYIGAIPLVIVHGPTDANALSDDGQLIELVRGVFGDGLVYVEFGNKPDLAFRGVRDYVAAWNAVVPTLHALAPKYRFVGPAASYPDPTYIATFDRLARPLPYANTWHEYACHPEDSDAYCIAHLDAWTAHVQAINRALQAVTGTAPPIMITEWNLDDKADVRFGNSAFMREWTARALETLAANQRNGLIAAMQYCVTNSEHHSLVGPTNSLTPEGEVLFQELARSDQTPGG